MPLIQHILFPFDFSQPSVLAAPFVQAVAERFKARLTLLSVVPPIWEAPPTGMPVLAATEEDKVEQALKSRLDAALPEQFAGLCVQRVTDYGDPALRIMEFAHANAVDLIMMPTHGFGLFRSLLIGSVTAKVLHDAKCAVWTATHAEEQKSRHAPKTILCAVDGSPKTPELIQWAAEFGQRMGAAVKLLHVVPPISDLLVVGAERELQEQMREQARSKIDGQQRSAGVELPLRVAVGPIADTLTEEARQEAADLIVIGRGSIQATLGRLRTHAYAIVQRSPCPVVSV